MVDKKNEIEKILLDILVKLAFSDEALEVVHLANEFNISKPKAQYYLDELLEKEYIQETIYGSTAYYISKSGRKLLFEKDLL